MKFPTITSIFQAVLIIGLITFVIFRSKTNYGVNQSTIEAVIQQHHQINNQITTNEIISCQSNQIYRDMIHVFPNYSMGINIFPLPKFSSYSNNFISGTKSVLTIGKYFDIRIDDFFTTMRSSHLLKSLHLFCNTSRYYNYNESIVNVYNIRSVQVNIWNKTSVVHRNKILSLSKSILSTFQIGELYENDEFYDLNVILNATDDCKHDGDKKSNYHCVTAEITAVSTKGVINALSSLSQLLTSDIPILLSKEPAKLDASYSVLRILDWPDNRWRGLLVDVARHFQPIKLLKRCVDAMHVSKLNMLHLHLTDSQSFPILLSDVNISSSNNDGESQETLELSKLAQQGSFSTQKRYSKADLIELVDYAHVRGIEIVPELDMPAHSLSWGSAFRDVIINCTTTARAAQTPWNIYPLDPSSEKLYKIIFHVLAQLVEVFPSRYFHVGGDEVSEKCWQEDTRLMQWAKDSHISSKEITKYFEERVFSMVYRLGKVPIVWQGVLDSNSMPKPKMYGNNSKLFEKYFKHKSASSNSKLWSLYGGNRSDVAVSHGDDDDVSSSKDVDESARDYRPIVEPWKCWGGLLRVFHSIVFIKYVIYLPKVYILASFFPKTDISTVSLSPILYSIYTQFPPLQRISN